MEAENLFPSKFSEDVDASGTGNHSCEPKLINIVSTVSVAMLFHPVLDTMSLTPDVIITLFFTITSVYSI